MIRGAIAGLLDQKTPFGRLALLHVVMTAGDTLVTVSLADSLFFSISPGAAKDRVILYLLLTMAPFAVVAPLLGPVIDRSRGARRATLLASLAAVAGLTGGFAFAASSATTSVASATKTAVTKSTTATGDDGSTVSTNASTAASMANTTAAITTSSGS